MKKNDPVNHPKHYMETSCRSVKDGVLVGHEHTKKRPNRDEIRKISGNIPRKGWKTQHSLEVPVRLWWGDGSNHRESSQRKAQELRMHAVQAKGREGIRQRVCVSECPSRSPEVWGQDRKDQRTCFSYGESTRSKTPCKRGSSSQKRSEIRQSPGESGIMVGEPPKRTKSYRASVVGQGDTKDIPRSDPVNHPRHYTALPAQCSKCGYGIECVQVTEWFNFCLGNAIKYIWRADLKHDAVEDLKKAAFYINREISRREKMKGTK